MISQRPWIALLLAGWCLSGMVAGQESTGGGSSSSGSSGGGSSGSGSGGSTFGSGRSSGTGTGGTGAAGTGTSGTGTSTSGTGTGTSGTGTGTSGTGTTGTGTGGTGTGGTGGASSAFGTWGSGGTGTGTGTDAGTGAQTGTRKPPATTEGAAAEGGSGAPARASSFSVPGFYGRSSETLTVGVGRLARPRFRYTGSISVGFDDNIFQTPTDSREIPAQVVEVVVTPAEPARTDLVPIVEKPVPVKIPAIRPPPREQRFRTVVTPAKDAVTEQVVVVPATPAQKRQGSLVERANVGVEIQFASRRSLFTFDFGMTAENTQERPKDQPEYSGNMSFTFVYKVAPRLQFSANFDAAYLTQPDVSRINTPDTQGGGAYLNTNAKFDLSYRVTPRLTVDTSLSYASLLYQEKAQEGANFTDTTLGLELRYLYTPRFTLIGETRYSSITYDTSSDRDSTTVFFLIGGDLRLSNRTNVTLRLGEAMRTFEQTGKTSSSPYLEGTLNYRIGPASVLAMNTRFGFEEPQDASSEVQAFRLGLNFTQFFSPRLRGTLGLTGIHRVTTNSVAELETSQDTFDMNMGFEYSFSRHWTFTGSYSLTIVITSEGQSDYYRNRLFLGFQYEF